MRANGPDAVQRFTLVLGGFLAITALASVVAGDYLIAVITFVLVGGCAFAALNERVLALEQPAQFGARVRKHPRAWASYMFVSVALVTGVILWLFGAQWTVAGSAGLVLGGYLAIGLRLRYR